MTRPQIWEKAVNDYWRQRSLTDDEFYFGLGDRIQARRQSKIPIAGAGAVEAIDKFATVFSGIGYIFPPARKIALMFESIEQLARERSGLTE